MSLAPLTLCTCTAEAIRDLRRIGRGALASVVVSETRGQRRIFLGLAQDAFRRAGALLLDERRRLAALGYRPDQTWAGVREGSAA